MPSTDNGKASIYGKIKSINALRNCLSVSQYLASAVTLITNEQLAIIKKF